jgi:hypothetical protein
MTYQPPQTVSVALLKITWSSNLATNDYVSFTSEVNNISGLSISTTDISLPAGCYSVEASFGADRTNGFSDELFFQIEVGGVLAGNIGAADCSSASNTFVNVDQAVTTFELRSADTLKIQCTSCTASAWTANADYSYVLIRRAL